MLTVMLLLETPATEAEVATKLLVAVVEVEVPTDEAVEDEATAGPAALAAATSPGASTVPVTALK